MLARTVVIVGTDVVGSDVVVVVLVVVLVLLASLVFCLFAVFWGCHLKKVCLLKVSKLCQYPLLFLIKCLTLLICFVFILLCPCSLILLMKCIHLMM